ncbi:MAG TPA: hypothetical protein VGO00_22540 [Kofleriaceae bacterium]|nr:hypothetical protein [Kofleriaceae bacterium]
MRLAVVVLVTACHTPAPTTGVLATDAIVSVHSNVRDAELFVDGRDVGPLLAVRGGVALVPGFHRLELRREDFFSSYLELELGRAERKKVAMDMSPILP